MGRPSMFNRDYHRIMRRRKIVFRTVIIIIALCAIFLAYNKSAITDLKKIVADLGGSSDNSSQIQDQKPQENNSNLEGSSEDGVNHQQDTSAVQDPEGNGAENTVPQVTTGEFTFTFPNNEILYITYEKNDEAIKITGIKTDNKGISSSIRDDGKAIVFDNPGISGIWIFNADNTSKRLDPAAYRQIGGEGLSFIREDVMGEYENYIWAAKPQFLKDGRIIYQSDVPWFKKENNIYLWVADSSGENNVWLLNTGQQGLLNYAGFSQDNKLIIEMNGKKYALNAEDGSMVNVD